MNVNVSYESASPGNAHAYADALLKGCLGHRARLAAPFGGLIRISAPVDYFRLLFAYTGIHVPRAREHETRGGSL
jgi:hypothetical protein